MEGVWASGLAALIATAKAAWSATGLSEPALESATTTAVLATALGPARAA